MSKAKGAVAEHFRTLERLLAMESDAQARQARERAMRYSGEEAERGGDCLVGLQVVGEEAGLGGLWLVSLVKRSRPDMLPWTRLDNGSPVLLTLEQRSGSLEVRGVVAERTEGLIRVAIARPLELDDGRRTFRLDRTADETARQRQSDALRRTANAGEGRLAELREILVGDDPPGFDPVAPTPFLDPALNDSQKEAIDFALAARDVAVIHGPPGTGKTTTLVELVRQAVRRGQRVLVCAPSNMATDNLLERLVAHGENAVRLGHPARVMGSLREHVLDALVEDHPDTRLARKLTRDATNLLREAERWTRAKPPPGAKQDQRREARALLADARKLESRAVHRILDGADILCSTLTGLDGGLLGDRRFDLAVIDEAGQSVEPACWIPLLRCDRVVLAGDPCQLPPTIVSREAQEQGFGVSLLERLTERLGERVTRMLRVQYRMHEQIMEFSSREFYRDRLEADETVRRHQLDDLPGVAATPLTSVPVKFLDTAGAGFDEQVEEGGESKFNPQEARVLINHVEQLLAAGVRPSQIAVIAPYSAQVRWLRNQLSVHGLEVDSIDGFQGREKEVVLLSLVRSNPAGEVGFLSDVRRTNVALTRARRLLMVVGDSATLCSHPFYGRMLTYFEEIGAYHTVWEEGLV